MKWILFSTLFFLFYIQFSPQMGKVWWRNGKFTPIGAVKLMIYPLKNYEMWLPKLWDINYFMWLLGGYAIYKI